ncbi:MAG: hypothetical protein MRERC_1c024 [Mycoplasmataceae bacterium RC_NB112A]|nr:MAG: hypothetical protein MRERC_10c009 [Mycoplasmataceae bacterium RC_NB112A]KLL02444.1 MAG: hypothetical protein MRERC_1c024 [Mycoplasmataceae bacterium RC_NB112A]
MKVKKNKKTTHETKREKRKSLLRRGEQKTRKR